MGNEGQLSGRLRKSLFLANYLTGNKYFRSVVLNVSYVAGGVDCLYFRDGSLITNLDIE